jgi:hypothetical protein
MLAAFPPPVQPANRQSRGSWFRQATTSWPLPLGADGRDAQATRAIGRATPDDEVESPRKGGRRCCGLPLWAFILVIIIVLGIIAAAILVPLEFFVFRRLNGNGPSPEPALAQCQAQLACSNGGTNVISQGVCSCICTNGFTGSNCTLAGATGCTTTNIVSMGDSTNFNNVTLGQAIPRLIVQGQSNFSIPLSGTAILAKFNTGSLSCIAQNSLVTFDGRSMRLGSASSEVVEGVVDDAAVREAAFIPVSIITVSPGVATTITFNAIETGVITGPNGQVLAGFQTLNPPFSVTTIFAITTTIRLTPQPASTIPPTTTTTVTTTLSAPAATFTVTEEVLDFARVAMLFVLQEDSFQQATSAQTALQRFLTTASQGSLRQTSGVTRLMASNLTLGSGNSIDLVNFRVDIGRGVIGGRPTSSRRSIDLLTEGELRAANFEKLRKRRGGGALLSKHG